MTETYTITPLTTPNEQPAILRDGQRMTIHEVCRELNRMSGEAKAKNYTDETRWCFPSSPNWPLRICGGVVMVRVTSGWHSNSAFPSVESLLSAEKRGELIRVVP